MRTCPHRHLLFAVLTWAASAALDPQAVFAAADNAGVVLRNLPEASTSAYADLKSIAGVAAGEMLEMTRAEMWSVPRPRLDALKDAAAKLGVEITTLDESWNHALAPMIAAPPMSASAKEMMHDTMQQKPVVGMIMMALPQPEVLEYALTKGMHANGPASEPSTLVVQLTDALSVTLRRTSIAKTHDGYAWHGAAEETNEPATLLWWPDGRLSGNVTYKGHVYSVRNIGGGMHGVIELRPDMLPPEHAPMDKALEKKMNMKQDPLVHQGDASMLSAAPAGKENDPPTRSELRNRQDAPAPVSTVAQLYPATISSALASRTANAPDIVITVLVAYTKAAARYYTDIEKDLAAVAIEDANQSFRNSGLSNISLELVHTYETDYVESGSHFDHVIRFANDKDGYMDEVHVLRNQYRADVAILIVDNPVGCGLAAQVRAPENRAFAVVDQACVATSYSLAHEIGHIIGARHDPALDDSSMPFAYGHGYVHGTEWRTMMSYKESCGGCPRLPVWSSPLVKINGIPAGDETSDNARVIAEEAARVAAFR